MKRIITILLVLIMCVSLCACGGDRDIASPSGDDAENADSNVGNTPIDESKTPDGTNAVNGDTGEAVEEHTEAPENSEESTVAAGDLDMDISYGDGMTVTESGNDDTVSINNEDGSKLYVKDVTGEYDPNIDDPAQFLYEYAYESCVEIVGETFGEITQFNGEYPIAVANNELYGYAARMVCENNVQVYAFIKLVNVEDGYAVMIGVCEESSMNVFDNVTID